MKIKVKHRETEIVVEDDYEGLNGNNSDYFNPWLN
jgi:hypothetical protein